jgi:hypothetical protein
MENKPNKNRSSDKAKSKRINKKTQRFRIFIRKPPELFNFLSGLSGICLYGASNYIHGVFGIILFWFSGLFIGIGLHFELIRRTHFNINQAVVPFIFLILVSAYLFQPPETKINKSVENVPFINYKIEKFDLDSTKGKMILRLRVVNTSEHRRALNFMKVTTASWDSLPAYDSSWAIDVLKRHKNDEGTLGPRELMIFPPIELGGMEGPIKNRKYSHYLGVREYFKNMDIYILGAYSYRDEANNRYLCMYCIRYDVWTDSQFLYPKYNFNIPVNW